MSSSDKDESLTAVQESAGTQTRGAENGNLGGRCWKVGPKKKAKGGREELVSFL